MIDLDHRIERCLLPVDVDPSSNALPILYEDVSKDESEDICGMTDNVAMVALISCGIPESCASANCN